MRSRYHHLIEANVESLRPTQMTIGLGEVQQKRELWQTLSSDERHHYLSEHWFPAVRGPKGHFYITDHHHLGYALIQEKVDTVRLLLWKNFEALAKDEFWVVMDHHQWVHPYNAKGQRCAFDEIPKTIGALSDDPYRTLAAAVRRAGGFPKDQTPFAEFLWADFFRRHIPVTQLKRSPQKSLEAALALAHDDAASHLPGWSGATVL